MRKRRKREKALVRRVAQLEGALRAHNLHRGIKGTTCTWTQLTNAVPVLRCVLRDGHIGRHQTKNGECW